MSVVGTYKATFAEATHCIFNGNLNDPCFAAIAIQRIIGRTKETVTLSKSGALELKRKAGKEYAVLTYQGFFGKERTTGHPFADSSSAVPNVEVQRRAGIIGTSAGTTGSTTREET